jgi:hypothetical protein
VPSGTILIVPNKKNKLKHFSKWGGVNGIEQFIDRETGCKPFSGAGINPRVSYKTTNLKSIDNTYYYDDNLKSIDNTYYYDDNLYNEDQIKYTLFGHSGDQDEKEPRFNEPLLNQEKTKHIYVYRVKQEVKKKEWI